MSQWSTLWLLGYGFRFTKSGVWNPNGLSGEGAPTPVSATSDPVVTVKSWADRISRFGATCQLLARIRIARLENLGVVATMLSRNSCRTSIPGQLLRHSLRLPGIATPSAVGFWPQG